MISNQAPPYDSRTVRLSIHNACMSTSQRRLPTTLRATPPGKTACAENSFGPLHCGAIADHGMIASLSISTPTSMGCLDWISREFIYFFHSSTIGEDTPARLSAGSSALAISRIQPQECGSLSLGYADRAVKMFQSCQLST